MLAGGSPASPPLWDEIAAFFSCTCLPSDPSALLPSPLTCWPSSPSDGQGASATTTLLRDAWTLLERQATRFVRRARVARIVCLVLSDYAFIQNKCNRIRRACECRREARRRIHLQAEEDEALRATEEDEMKQTELTCEATWEAAHVRNAQRLADAISDLGGLWIKFGQFIASRADVVPQAYLEVMSKLHDSMPPKPFDEVSETLRRSLGASYASMFHSFEQTPVACASIAQVHRATIRPDCSMWRDSVGTVPRCSDVAVKVRHRGIEDLLDCDLETLQLATDYLYKLKPELDFRRLAQEWGSEVPKEADFMVEGANMAEINGDLESARQKYPCEHPLFPGKARIPEVFFVSKEVLIMRFVEGIPLTNLEAAAAIPPEKLVEQTKAIYGHMLFTTGLFHGDPHAGNFIWQPEEECLYMLDFGLTKRLSLQQRTPLAKACIGLATLNIAAVAQALDDLEYRLESLSPVEKYRLVEFLLRDTTPGTERRTEGSAEVTGYAGLPALNRMPADALPSHMLFLFRVVELMRGWAATLQLRISFPKLLLPYAEECLRASGQSLPPPDPMLAVQLMQSVTDGAKEQQSREEAKRNLLAPHVNG